MFSFFRKIFKRKQKKSDLDVGFLFWGGGLRISDPKLRERHKTEWLESTFLDQSDEELSRTDNKNYLGISIKNKTMVLFLSFVFLTLGILFVRAFYLQVVRGSYYSEISEKNRIRIIHLISPRGIIYDRNGVALVKNIPKFALFIVPYDFTQDEEKKEKGLEWIENRLSDLEYKESLEKVLATKPTRKEYFEPILVVDGLDYEQAMAMRIESLDYPGVHVEVTAKREYLTNYKGNSVLSLSHILGYEGKINEDEYETLSELGYLYSDNVGKIGVEKTFEKELRGKYGREQIEVDSTGKAVKIIARDDLTKGDNLYLSIDIEMQAKLESILREHMSEIDRYKAAAIVMNPQNGQVLSLISLPTFDNNLFSQGISTEEYAALVENENNPLFNRVISGEYPSGSTIKPIISVAALAEGVISEYTSFLSTGGIRIGQWFFPDWKSGGHGVTDVRKSLADSVNTFYYIIGGGYGDIEGLGVYKIKEYSEMFGLGVKTGIDLPNERSGFLPTPEWKEEVKNEQWYIGDTYHIAIGQGDVLVNPLQVANYIVAFANGGTLFKPQIASFFYNQEKEVEELVDPEVIREIPIDDYTIEVIRQGMRQASKTGSARILNSLPVSSGAKTGTAQWNQNEDPHAWFVSFAPYENPEISVTILVEASGEGSAVSAPIAYDFLSWYFRTYKKTYADEIKMTND